MPRREVRPEEIRSSAVGWFFLDKYQESGQSCHRIVNLNGFKNLVNRAIKTGRSLIVTYPRAEMSCDAWLVRLAEPLAAQPALQPQ